MSLAGIRIYPLKSGGGIELTEAELTPTGLRHDRRWMLVDEQGRFLSQRELPQMARLNVKLTTRLIFSCDGQNLALPLPPYTDMPEIPVTVWRSTVPAQLFGPDVNHWFTQLLGRPCRLVYMPDNTRRETNPEFAPGQQVSFADGYPYLLCNLASLRDLNQRLEAKGQPPVSMDRFRPNLIVEHDTPFAEDHWQQISLGEQGFKVVKPCERCVIITTDQVTAKVGKEPLTTLASFHKLDGKVIFGQNLVAFSHSGSLKIGDRLGTEI